MKTPHHGRFKVLAEEYPDLLLRYLLNNSGEAAFSLDFLLLLAYAELDE